jgi:hypothetical protein
MTPTCTSKRMRPYAREGGIGILMDGKEPMKEQVAAVLKANHGRLIHYWGHLTTQRLG